MRVPGPAGAEEAAEAAALGGGVAAALHGASAPAATTSALPYKTSPVREDVATSSSLKGRWMSAV